MLVYADGDSLMSLEETTEVMTERLTNFSDAAIQKTGIKIKFTQEVCNQEVVVKSTNIEINNMMQSPQ